MPSPWDKNDLVKNVAQGDYDRILSIRSKYDNEVNSIPPAFVRMLIIDVISDPSIIDSVKLSYWEHELGVSNIRDASTAPPNSIIAKKVMGNGTVAASKVMVLYPFFPPHLGLPAKPGEHVWAMFENPDAKVNEIGYWFCRIVGPYFVEDVNYTHADRQFDSSFVPGIADLFEGKDDPKYEFRNGAVGVADGERFSVGSTVSIIDEDEKVYEKLLTETDAAKIARYESVPRYKKRPHETTLVGSNNTLIVLGTDRTSSISDYDEDPEKGKTPKPIKDDVQVDGAGQVDIVVGRGQTETTGGKSVENSLGKKEIGKSKKEVVEKEGDIDLKNDRSRVRISQKTHDDKNFGIDKVVEKHTSKEKVKDSKDGNGYITIKSDKIRFIARQDVVILVSGVKENETDKSGNIKDSEIDIDKCASVTIRANGDIIFTPSKQGVVKFGGDDADLAVLCVKSPNANSTGGTVQGMPITNNFGGVNGAGGATGEWAKKVLLK